MLDQEKERIKGMKQELKDIKQSAYSQNAELSEIIHHESSYEKSYLEINELVEDIQGCKENLAQTFSPTKGPAVAKKPDKSDEQYNLVSLSQARNRIRVFKSNLATIYEKVKGQQGELSASTILDVRGLIEEFKHEIHLLGNQDEEMLKNLQKMIESLATDKNASKRNQYLENSNNKIQKGALSKLQNNYGEAIRALNNVNNNSGNPAQGANNYMTQHSQNQQFYYTGKRKSARNSVINENKY